MIVGLYAAATGLHAMEVRQDVTANNIANAMTPGYKKQSPVDKGFYELLYRSMRNPFWANRVTGPGGGVQTDETFSDFSAGALQVTGDKLHVALDGPGYLVVANPAGGEQYTRDGKLSIDIDGDLSTVNGLKLMSLEGGPISVVGETFSVFEDGTVLVDGQVSGTLRLIEFEDRHMLSRSGDNLLSASEAALQRSQEAAETRLVPGALEMSNVQIPNEMIQMLIGVRAYTANQRVFAAIDESAERLISQVGMPI